MFVGLWPKKREEVPVDLKKLDESFDTVEDLVLTMKSRSVKRGVKGDIALAQSHGEEVNWEKVSSSRARPLSELLGFFEKAKKYALGIDGFFNFYADLLDSCGKCFDASAKRWCCFFHTFYRHRAYCRGGVDLAFPYSLLFFSCSELVYIFPKNQSGNSVLFVNTSPL
jgi:hypothetical protein